MTNRASRTQWWIYDSFKMYAGIPRPPPLTDPRLKLKEKQQ